MARCDVSCCFVVRAGYGVALQGITWKVRSVCCVARLKSISQSITDRSKRGWAGQGQIMTMPCRVVQSRTWEGTVGQGSGE